MRLPSAVFLVVLSLGSCTSKCPDKKDPCCGDPCCGDPWCGQPCCNGACCGDPCCGDACCGDPCCGDPCCGDPCCGNCIDGSSYLSRQSRQPFASVKERAAYNLACASDGVTVQSIADQRYRAQGCGKTTTYVCACAGGDAGTCTVPTCRAAAPVSAAPAPASAPSASRPGGIPR